MIADARRSLTAAALVAALAAAVQCVPVGTPTRAAAYGPPGPAITAAEWACLAEKKVLFPGDGECYRLGWSGEPCKSGEWLVLDDRSPDRLRPVCAPVPCPDDNQVLWPRDGRCYQKFRDRALLCPHPSLQLDSNPFGLGECVCMQKTPHARGPAGPRDGPCHELYHRGPCQEGHILVPKANGTKEQGVCAADPCHQPKQAASKHAQAAAPVTLALWAAEEGGDNRCHPLGSAAPCQPPATFRVHPRTLRPGCYTYEELNLLPSTPCSGDRCSPTNTASHAGGYLIELIQAQKTHKRWRGGRAASAEAAASRRQAAAADAAPAPPPSPPL